LRRQALAVPQTALSSFTPKSMLRQSGSPFRLDAFSAPNPPLSPYAIHRARTILIASGKVGHELRARAPAAAKIPSPPFSFITSCTAAAQGNHRRAEAHPNARDVTWVAGGAPHMGPFFYLMPRLAQLCEPRSSDCS